MVGSNSFSWILQVYLSWWPSEWSLSRVKSFLCSSSTLLVSTVPAVSHFGDLSSIPTKFCCRGRIGAESSEILLKVFLVSFSFVNFLHLALELPMLQFPETFYDRKDCVLKIGFPLYPPTENSAFLNLLSQLLLKIA